jgi:hypothetical protein
MHRPPSPSRIINTDSLAFGAVLLPVALWSFSICLLAINPGRSGAYLFPWLPLLVTVMALGVLAWRVRTIRGVFTSGVEAPGRVKHIVTTRGGQTRIDFVYTHAGREYSGGNTTNQTRYTNKFKPNDSVVILLDPARPYMSFIRELYD